MPDSRPQAGSSATSADAVTEAGAPAAHDAAAAADHGHAVPRQGSRPRGPDAVDQSRRRHARRLRPDPRPVLQPTGQPFRGVRFVCPPAPGGLPRAHPHPSPLLCGPRARRGCLHRRGDGRLDPQGGGRRGDGGGGVLRPLPRDRVAAGRDRIDRDAPDLRVAGCGGPTGRRRRPAPGGVGLRVGVLRHRLHAGVADPVA